MIRDGVTEVVPGYVTNVITDDALVYIDAHAEDENPFYLSVHYTAPHALWIGHPQDIVDSYDDCAFETCPQEPLHPWAKVPQDDADAADAHSLGLVHDLAVGDGQDGSALGGWNVGTAVIAVVESARASAAVAPRAGAEGRGNLAAIGILGIDGLEAGLDEAARPHQAQIRAPGAERAHELAAGPASRRPGRLTARQDQTDQQNAQGVVTN